MFAVLLLNFAWVISALTGGHPEDCKDSYPPRQFEQVTLSADGLWKQFWFGEAGTWAFQSFYLANNIGFNLQVTDCFCPGDAFILYDNGFKIADVNLDCVVGPAICNSYSAKPEDCVIISSPFCKLPVPLLIQPGIHNFTLFISSSPLSYGSGFLKVVPLLED